MNIIIRKPEIDADFVALANLAQELAHYHHEDKRPSAEKLAADGDWFSARIASLGDDDVGFVGWHKLYACQSAERAMELQNIFVKPECRGQGIGFRLILEVIADALANNCVEIKIGLRKENTSALEFYKMLGCEVIDRNDSWRCKLKRHEMHKLISKKPIF